MKIHRLLAILTVLLARRFVTAAELSKKLDVSIRTIYRDIRDLESAGIPIVSSCGSGGGIGILESYKIEKGLFTADDIKTLTTSLTSLKNSSLTPKANETLEKIKSLVPDEEMDSLELSSRKLHIDIEPWTNNAVLQKNLRLIENALDEARLLEIEYTSLKSAKAKRIIEPHQLILKENSWYLKAFCRNRNEFRVFKLRRISAIKFLDEKFSFRDFDTRVGDFKDWEHEKKLMVDMLADESLKEQALDFCREENIFPQGNGKILLRILFVESDIGYGYLMSMGHRAVCLRPSFVREELKRRVRLLYEAYES